MSTMFKVGDAIKSLYRVMEIKRGGMGVVYICQRLPTDEVQSDLRVLSESYKRDPEKLRRVLKETEWVVFKSLENEQQFWHDEVRDRFQREVLICITIAPHPNIVRVRSVDTITKLYFLFLEYVDGGNLRDRINGQPLSLDNFLDYSMQFCHGMEFLHDNYNIIHRDIKPENILISKTGVLKIADFGLSKNIDIKEAEQGELASSNDDVALTKHGAIFGTVPYMSPEHFTDPLSVRKTSDIYSFGVVMYEMLTGRLPFSGRSVNDFRLKHLNSLPVLPSELVQTPKQLDLIIMKCLQKKEKDRFSSFTELLSALEIFCKSQNKEHLISSKLTLKQIEDRMDAQDWQGRGYAYGQIGQRGDKGALEKSLECYQRSLELDPLLGGGYINVGQGLKRLGRKQEALYYFEKEVEVNPDSAMSYQGLAMFYWQIGRREEAIRTLEKCLALGPNRIAAWGELALMCRAMEFDEKHKSAILSIEKLLDVDGFNDAYTAYGEAIYFGENEDFDAALYFHSISIDRFPKDHLCWYNSAVTFHKLKRYQEAKFCYDEAIKNNPNFALSLINRGVILLESGHVEAALRDWERAVGVDPMHPTCKSISELLPMSRNLPKELLVHSAKVIATLMYSF